MSVLFLFLLSLINLIAYSIGDTIETPKKGVVILFKMKFNKIQFTTYLLGCLLFSIGAKFFIDSHLGTDPLDVMVIGIVQHIGLTIGIVSGIISIFFLAIWSLWNKKIPPISPFITMFLIGSLIDIWNVLKIENLTAPYLSPFVLLVVAIILAAYGSSLIIMSGIGIRIMDLIAITMVEKLKWHFFYAKMLLEIFFVVTGVLLSGPFGIGTFAFLFFVSPGIVLFMSANEKYLHLINYGLKKPTYQTVQTK